MSLPFPPYDLMHKGAVSVRAEEDLRRKSSKRVQCGEAWREGRDSQLEKAIEIALAELKKQPSTAIKKPEYPNYQPKPATSGGR